MLLDTTYLLPIIKVSVKGIKLEKIKDIVKNHEVVISDISITELVAKGGKLVKKRLITKEDVLSGVQALLSDKKIGIRKHLESLEIISTALKLREVLDDFLDCIIVSTALYSSKILLTEDYKILNLENNELFEEVKKNVNPHLRIMTLETFLG